VRRDLGRASAATCHRVGYQQVDGYSVARAPGAQRRDVGVWSEATSHHGVLHQRIGPELGGVNGEIRVGGELRERDPGAAGVQIDRLGTDQNHSIALRAKRF